MYKHSTNFSAAHTLRGDFQQAETEQQALELAITKQGKIVDEIRAGAAKAIRDGRLPAYKDRAREYLELLVKAAVLANHLQHARDEMALVCGAGDSALFPFVGLAGFAGMELSEPDSLLGYAVREAISNCLIEPDATFLKQLPWYEGR